MSPTGQFTPSDIDSKGQFKYDPLDFTDQYNTPLSPSQQLAYNQWAKSMGQDPTKGRYDYDLQGAYLAGVGKSGGGHFPDTFKKPNHPTFSNESQYSGIDGYVGGQWTTTNGKPSYQPSRTNLTFRTPNQLQSYFSQTEPDTQLLPGIPLPTPSGKSGNLTLKDLTDYGNQFPRGF